MDKSKYTRNLINKTQSFLCEDNKKMLSESVDVFFKNPTKLPDFLKFVTNKGWKSKVNPKYNILQVFLKNRNSIEVFSDNNIISQLTFRGDDENILDDAMNIISSEFNELIEDSLNEDGGTYSLSIEVYDSGDRVNVNMKDSEDWAENKVFNSTKEAANYIINYVSQWE